MNKRFAIVGHMAPSSGKLSLNDLAGNSGRMDVLIRAVNAALFVSHGIRKDTDIVLHLCGGPGPDRRILFNGETLSGVRPDERSIGGQIKAILKRPVPPLGVLDEVTQGIFDTRGNLKNTLKEWENEGFVIYVLDAEGHKFNIDHMDLKIGFILSDHLPYSLDESILLESYNKISLGKKWLQGHSCITIVHHVMDSR